MGTFVRKGKRKINDTYQDLLNCLAKADSPKTNKYHAKSSGGYDSRKEHRRANELKMLQRAGAIANLREQVPFLLIPAQRGDDGKVIERACSYIADFVYTDNSTGCTVVEDTKGVRTKEYIIKRKLMLHVHGIRITEK